MLYECCQDYKTGLIKLISHNTIIIRRFIRMKKKNIGAEVIKMN